MKNPHTLPEFLHGFARAADIDRTEADAAWAAYSRQLSGGERERIENQGQDAGFEMGQQWKAMP
jgi:hypothetical protein